MKNISPKMKKWSIIAGLGVVGCVLLFMIISSFSNAPNIEPQEPIPKLEDDEVMAKPEINPERKDDLKVEPSTQPTSNGADSTGTEQTIQPDPVKPPEPAKEELKNPEAKPKTTESKPKSETKKADSNTSKPKSDTPKTGDKNGNGQVYVEGFGWVEDEGENSREESQIDPEHDDIDKIIGY